jgi:two-component system OmpR family response regulator
MDTTPLSVLVIDDNRDTADSLAEILVLYGFTARSAYCGQEGLREATSDPPDVIFLDIGMPSMDGWEVARRLRNQADGNQPFMIAVTGYGMESDRWKSADSGIDMHLVKPAEPTKLIGLLEWIKTTLGKHALNDGHN